MKAPAPVLTALVGAATLFSLTGCAARKVRPITDPNKIPGNLHFLVDGQTTKEQVSAKLDLPVKTFESGRILAYRLNCQMEAVGGWTDVCYSLILVLDAEGVLERHRLVRVK